MPATINATPAMEQTTTNVPAAKEMLLYKEVTLANVTTVTGWTLTETVKAATTTARLARVALLTVLDAQETQS